MAGYSTDNKNKELGNKIVQIARSYINKLKYAANQQGGDGKIDEGNFVQKVLTEAGATMGANKPDEIMIFLRDNGGKVWQGKDSAAMPGDILLFKHTKDVATKEGCDITHVAINVDGKKMIDCSEQIGGVTERDILSSEHILGRVRENSAAAPNDSKMIAARTVGNQSGFGGIRSMPAGKDHVMLTMLPEGKTYCEPIYPDFITISDTVPKWALSATVNTNNAKKESGGNIVTDTVNKVGKSIVSSATAGAKQGAGIHIGDNPAPSNGFAPTGLGGGGDAWSIN